MLDRNPHGSSQDIRQVFASHWPCGTSCGTCWHEEEIPIPGYCPVIVILRVGGYGNFIKIGRMSGGLCNVYS